ncbi:hypothetical protein DU500_13870 [Haloplanus rubicundus]|uniref:DUF7513 domain-containing protein n=1 Tax=Haloplanus rubicundus TaxID=1547898 RepID=A0A345E5F2_9EURY|nr:hypothetical protein [Haloplanus rubicundus]AXG07424.1 hypothetical protein DU500_13870 [Haloplanus rubicundus]
MNLGKLFAGWTFRTNRPSYAVGDELTAFVTGYEDGVAQVRIGDTIITLADADRGLDDRLVRLRVTEFDADDATGSGELLGVVDDA